jgi:hypothetical protein
MKLKLMSLAMFAALIGAFVLAPLSASAQDSGTGSVLVSGSNSSGNKSFDGQWTLTEFVEQDGQVFASGILSGDVSNKHGKVTKTVEETVLLPVYVVSTEVASTTAGVRALQTTDPVCDVLNLVLGPITLSLLGLDLFIGGEGGVPIVVDLNADPAGGLLGQLLCGLAGGVPITGPLGQLLEIIGALNTLLGLLG